ncbi:MAG: VWA domain-containing protein [Clostridia bacterium]|nr:VWA domain-containing protein [Clostridia bacterium]
MKKNKIFRKAMSLLLSLAILMGTLAIAIPMMKVNVSAITTSDGETITQTQIVTSNRDVTYGNYAAQYLNGAGEATDMVIPGLAASEDYVVQGISYYPAKDWMVVTAYYNAGDDETPKSSKMFCLDAKTGNFVAMFSFLNVDGTVNTDHGGGIAFSENNIYYSCGDKDRKIAYAPLSALDDIETGEHKEIQLAGEAVFTETGSVTSSSKTAYTAYVCYDQGYLWMGNFYDRGASLAGITIAAADYNVPATAGYNSMVYGYKLQGSNSQEEWNNLINGTADCKGSPSQAIALDNNIKDVQYAVVDNGKLYLSCSYGSGSGNSVSFGFGATSKLITADIDLSAQPAIDIEISISEDNNTKKTIKAHKVSEYETYDMMPMSEGLCFVNGLIFCTFEGASNKYLNESSGLTSIGNCEKPVDVIWKINPYALENRVEVADTPATHYEKVNSLSEIENGEEYLIVYESPVKDPVTQKNILYAIDANGGYKGFRLSKNSIGAGSGYTGAIAHPITQYSIEDGKLYLGNAEKDDVKNLRWEINSLSGSSYSMQSPDYYFVNQPNLYFDASTISMATNTVRGNNMRIQESGDGEGGFWISNNETYFLWCNDGTTESYNTAYNNYYANSTIPMYSGVTEQPGTLHTDALNMSGSNVLGGAVITGAESFYAHGIFNIYKRIVDKTASTYESRVYTDMKAELQADGTYTIDLETYAISPNHYQYVGDRPTDYIIVMDRSQSVAYTETTDCNTTTKSGTYDGTALRQWAATDSINVAELCEEDDTKTPASGSAGVNGYAFSDPDNQIYMLHTDGKYYRVYIAVNTLSLNNFGNPNKQYYWAYYVADDGLYYVLQSAGESSTGASYVHDPITRDQFYSNVDNAVAQSGISSSTNNGTRREAALYTGVHYTYTCGVCDLNVTTRIDTIKAKAAELVGEIAAQGSDNRIAITYYGASASYLGTNGWSSSGFTDAFWNAGANASNLKTQIANISDVSNDAQTDNSGMELAFADNIINASGVDYTADGDRNCVIIFMSDGVPGADDKSNTTTAANNVIAKSLEAKNKGAFVYSIIVGEDGANFDKHKYMEAVSSKYPGATSLTDLGGSNIDGAKYTSNLGDITVENFMDFAPIIGREFAKNEAVGLANLDASSILCEELSTAFKGIVDENGNLADGIKVSYKLVPGSYDKVERFAFDESSAVSGSATGLSVSYDASNSHKLTVSGYDYSEEYISKNKSGRKLQIRIEGVLADEEADITNTSINNASTTAIYQTEGEYNSADTFKYFPTEYFNIPTYTYVLDYDLPMYDSDINGTLCSVDGGLNRQSTYKTSRETDNVALNFVNGNLDMTYELVSGSYTNEENRSFCLIKRDDGTYDWFRINIVPASTVLFEENRFTASSLGSLAKSNWKSEGSTIATGGQSLSGENDRYGYDSAYANNGDSYSNGTVLKATVNSSTKRSETMTFSYTGTGFDLMAVCGANTGVQLVNIKKADGTIEKVFMVDTYYVDTENYDGALLKQVPIVSYTNEGGYGDYTVEVTAAYLSNAQGITGGRSSLFNKTYTAQNLLKDMGINMPLNEVEFVWYNDNSILNGGTGPVADNSSANRGTATAADVALDCYIDGIRIYNPLGNDSSLYINSEKGAKYYNIVNELASGENGVITGGDGLFAYVVGELSADEDGNIPTLSFGNYQSVGPQNEIYLQSATGGDDSHAVAFNVAVPNADSRVMISLRAVDGATTAKVASGDEAIEFAINTATEQYFDITPYLTINASTGMANVIITNNGTGLLSVNNLKLVDATAQVVTSEDLPVMARSFSLTPRTVDPNSYNYNAITGGDTQQPDVDEPGNDNTDVEVPVIVDNIFTRIIAFFKNLFAFIFKIF